MKAYRIGSSRHPLWDGLGAAVYGSRWTSPGRNPIFAAEFYSGALLETLVHMGSMTVPSGYQYIEIDFPNEIAAESVEIASFPKESITRAIGDKWFDTGSAAVLFVPSVVTRVERNIVFNPRHPDFRRIVPSEPKPVFWDYRLFRK